MQSPLTLQCPIRGTLKARTTSRDGLGPLEECYRVEAIKYLLRLGYPRGHFKIEVVVKQFGNSGRNSVRADFAVLDVPVDSIPAGDVDTLLEHAILLCEVKRENANHEYVKNTQVKPLLDFAKLDRCIALYWDNVDQRVFWHERFQGKKQVKEGPLAILPRFGGAISLKPLAYQDTKASENLLSLFDRIENLLHSGSIDPEQRFGIILQLILAKLFDEHGHQSSPSSELNIQDYESLGYDGASALRQFNDTLEKSVSYYQRHLPRPVETRLSSKVTIKIFFEICRVLAPIRITASKREVVQSFYMKFAKGLYKWDLAQYFTPPTVTDFIVDILNPQFSEHIKDPACGSADFLTAAFHRRRDSDPNYASCIWGADNSKNAVQVAILNMMLNGDGKSNIIEEDSLAVVDEKEDQYEIVVCNPPFGVKITEKNTATLRKFDMGHEWEELSDGKFNKKDALLDSQQTGILFAELCVKQAKPGGRIAIILPNGYLGNRSQRYRLLRDWLLRHCRLVAICSFPRFTFKTSGADVSASVVYFQKREVALESIHDEGDYGFAVEMIENVGWNLGDKKADPRYLRNAEDGSYIIDDEGNKKLDSDFESALQGLRSSEAALESPWLVQGHEKPVKQCGWSVPILDVLTDNDLTLDPKRYCKKYRNLRDQMQNRKHFKLGDVVDFIDENTTAAGEKNKKKIDRIYNYVEIQDIGEGYFSSTELRGWELPQRAKHFAEPGDIFIGSIWGSVTKWCIAPNECSGRIVFTNGCHRMRLKKGKEHLITDLCAFLCTEAYAVQMRAMARGSDGLAEITIQDAHQVLIAELSDEERKQLQPYIDSLAFGVPNIPSKVNSMTTNKDLHYPIPPKRPSHVVLV